MGKDITYEDIFNASNNGVVVTDAQGFIVCMNRQAEEILAADAETIVGTFISTFLPLTGPQVVDCLKTGQAKLGHHIIGKQVDLVLNISVIRKHGRLCGAVCNFQTMSQFESSAKKLESYRRLTRQLETIFESSSDGIWVCDGTGKVINLNAASAELNGIEAESILGKNIDELVAAKLFDRSVTQEVLKTRRKVSIMQYIHRTGRYLLATGTPVFDEGGNVSLVVVNERDMTQLNALYSELEQSQMIAEKIKDELAELTLRELKNPEIVAESPSMRSVMEVALKLARNEASNILILGESGTGKGLIAKFIHKTSRRGQRSFVQINCAALPESLLEAELFGYEKGAFTGALEKGKAGLFELAHEGTLFLDEIGDLPLPLQAKLLKYLDDHEVMRLGGVKSMKSDCIVIAATNQDLEGLVKKRLFRKDLYYRLNAFTLFLPPLRERPDDIFELVQLYLKRYSQEYRINYKIHSQAMSMLQAYPFPGNVRELKNIVRKAVIMSETGDLDEFILGALKTAPGKPKPGPERQDRQVLSDALLSLERKILENALKRCGSTRALASELGISQPTVVRKLKKHRLARQ